MVTKFGASLLLISIGCRLRTNYCKHFNKRLIVFVYFKTVENFWQFLGKTEASNSVNPYFDRCLTLPQTIHSLTKIELKLNLYSLIETITNTKCLLGYSYLTFQIKSFNKNKSIHRIDLKSSVNKQIIGVLTATLSHSNAKSGQNLRKISSFDCIDCIEGNNTNNYNRIEYDFNRNKSTKELNKIFRTNSLPNICEFAENMSNFEQMISNLFTNTICKSFQFSIPKQKTIAFIDEFMSESELSMSLPQILM